MPFDKDDVRSKLNPGPQPHAAPDYSGMSYGLFWQLPPVEAEDGHDTWWARGQNFVLGYTDVHGTAVFERPDEAQEHVLVLCDEGLSAVIEGPGGERVEAPGRSLVVLPPGRTVVTVTGTGRAFRLIRSTAEDLVARCVNRDDYAEAHLNIPPFQAWPDPVDGFRIRVYDLTVPAMSKPPFRLFRCTTFMVNYIDPIQGPRSLHNLSPHYHDDFEQASLTIAGDYVHHIRWPWTTDRAVWREDEHAVCSSPSLAVIPPPSIHTSEATGEGENHLIDIFSPPRFDFSAQEGWVLNADEYPAPA
jgi:hypothetical protein